MKRIAILAGDGIGPEVMQEAVKVLDIIQQKYNFQLQYEYADIAGQGIANPVAQVLSAAMMLRFSLGYEDAADAIESAVADVLKAGIHTLDIAIEKDKAVGTREMGDAIKEQIEGKAN